MTNAPSAPNSQNNGDDVHEAYQSSQLGKEAGGSKPTGVEEDANTSFAQMESLVASYRKDIPTRCDQASQIITAYSYAREISTYHRLASGVYRRKTVNLDTATDSKMSHISALFDRERQAMDACYEMVALTRSDLAELEEIKQMCSEVLQKVEGTSRGIHMETEARKLAGEASRRQKRLTDRLKYFM